MPVVTRHTIARVADADLTDSDESDYGTMPVGLYPVKKIVDEFGVFNLMTIEEVMSNRRMTFTSHNRGIVLKHAARGQFSAHRTPTPEQMQQLLVDLEFNTPNILAYEILIHKTMTFIQNNIVAHKLAPSLTEIHLAYGEWNVKWASFTAEWEDMSPHELIQAMEEMQKGKVVRSKEDLLPRVAPEIPVKMSPARVEALTLLLHKKALIGVRLHAASTQSKSGRDDDGGKQQSRTTSSKDGQNRPQTANSKSSRVRFSLSGVEDGEEVSNVRTVALTVHRHGSDEDAAAGGTTDDGSARVLPVESVEVQDSEDGDAIEPEESGERLTDLMRKKAALDRLLMRALPTPEPDDV
ncbi:hypothetical protein CAC42_3654 [Sphaceloma murrayae]|uniref:Uncharacterized protein n=1 Tax=Sphaceloma murrayae TaxID=2082308 RepID=A0A2K1QPR3_9PEZI|nr:hypothetical protein CAC42_3654 [Sphaceloma murrayae]